MTIADLIREWRHIAGPRVASITTPSHVQAHVLVVLVPASPFTSQLNAESPAIIDRLGLVDGVEIVAIEWRMEALPVPRHVGRRPCYTRRSQVNDE